MYWLGLASDRFSSLHSDTTGTTESTGSLKVSENVQSDIWDNRGEFQPGLSYAHLLLCIFGSGCMPRSNSQTFSVPEQILFDPALEHSSHTDTARFCAWLLSHRHSPTVGWGPGGCMEPPAAWEHPMAWKNRLHLAGDVSNVVCKDTFNLGDWSLVNPPSSSGRGDNVPPGSNLVISSAPALNGPLKPHSAELG